MDLEHQTIIRAQEVQGADAQDQSGPTQSPCYPKDLLEHCVYACLCKVEREHDNRKRALKKAAEVFKSLIINRHELSITTLFFILALLDAHWRRDVKADLLAECLATCSSLGDIPVKKDVLLLIRSKLDSMEERKGNRDFDQAVLRDIYISFQSHWGPRSPSTLACLVNLCWRLAGDKDTGRVEEAVILLSHARTDLEEVLGDDDPQTIMCLTVLARALFNLGRPVDGLSIMQTALQRIGRKFTHCHPYHLAALGRLSKFMQKVNKGDPERILWAVASKRLKIFGSSSPLTQNSEKEVVSFLMKRGKHAEAEQAHTIIAAMASEVDPGTNVALLFEPI